MAKWATVTVTDADGKRHSVDVQAESTFDAAHLYLVACKANPALPVASRETVFEVVSGGKLYRVTGDKLQQWIVKRRQEWNGPRGMLFSKRPTLEEEGPIRHAGPFG